MSKKPALLLAALALSVLSIAATGPERATSRPVGDVSVDVASDPLVCPLCGGGFAHFQALLRTTLDAGISAMVASRVR